MQIKFVVVAGPHRGREFVFSEHDSFVVGRGPQAHFRLARLDQYFSRLHFMVEVNPPRCRIVDLNSRNGILVNDATVRAADLNHGDIIQAGKTQLLVQIDSDAGERLEDSAKTGSSSDQRPQAGSCDEPLIRQEVSTDRAIETLDERCVPVVPGKAVSRHSSRLSPDSDGEQIHQPQIVPGYQIVRELGRGGMGVVYQALRESDGSLVALKTILPAVVASPKQRERFLREARTLETLQHPGIVTFREMGECDGLLYFAMDYVPGTDAARLLRENNGPLAIGRAVRITCQMLEALGYAHERGFVHRDIKPANLLIDTSTGVDRVRLADFGLARVYQTSQISGLTMTGDIGGTPQFMPPEQILNFRSVQPASDQYAAAATLYYLLTSCPIYDFLPSAGAQLVMILQDEPVPIEQRRADLPGGLSATIHRALKRDVADRFASVREFREALRPFVR